ncbi:hypothetical protein ID866_9880 [Astraeus odoratus]|nr:hypothetical protein ID866_9880 [Astraeus odoratus]
MENWLLIKLQR